MIECCEEPHEPAPGHPVTEAVRVLATLRQFLREGAPWRSLRASAGKASGSTLRRAFERLFLAAFAVMARIRTVFADRGYDAEGNRTLCRSFGAEPQIRKRREPGGSNLGKQRWPVERSNA